MIFFGFLGFVVFERLFFVGGRMRFLVHLFVLRILFVWCVVVG